MSDKRDHGGGLDAAVAEYGGTRGDWLDLSTGINPVPYPVGEIDPEAWTALPDQGAMDRLLAAARKFWNVPEGAEIVAANGASAIIAKVPYLTDHGSKAYIPGPTYNEHAAAIEATGTWTQTDKLNEATLSVFVHPNNPTGRFWEAERIGATGLCVVDESFCDVYPHNSHVEQSKHDSILILKSFGKFWGLAGLRLGFAIGTAFTMSPIHRPKKDGVVEKAVPMATLQEHLGPWAVAGPALEIGARALEDVAWAEATRARLAADAARLDGLMTRAGAKVVGGTDLFRLYEFADAEAVQAHLAKGHVWSRIFPYSKTWLRLGLPHPDRWGQLEAAVEGLA
ncbi:threonine-phosphate decarboxylase [Octadecabacter ascidiaceicola]|uniref:Aminotransferase n=1 Tax=Octadecabacter ascidiaceicola TaxID=1655543 RepID=A0A238KBT3_9RHOB|nr:threonine-phosphate decarboxylase [Octadecabacter ascidiaceicola]SMX39854.1 Threonine-phosphate decarboxylase [Octadecabacter ascidiaceicola]